MFPGIIRVSIPSKLFPDSRRHHGAEITFGGNDGVGEAGAAVFRERRVYPDIQAFQLFQVIRHIHIIAAHSHLHIGHDRLCRWIGDCVCDGEQRGQNKRTQG